jgi:hypothetical protein
MREDEDWEAKSADIIAAWRNGDTSAVLRNPWNLPVMLRIRTFGADEDVQHDVAQVETSRGARIPVSHAIRGLRFVRSVVQRGEAFQTNGHTFHLGHYKIDRIDVDGIRTCTVVNTRTRMRTNKKNSHSACPCVYPFAHCENRLASVAGLRLGFCSVFPWYRS